MINITKINVPAGIRYISDWKEFKLPNFPHILDKQIPGCGFTEWSLTNNEDTVLCSPRKILLQNKNDQHLGDVYYLVNDYEQIIDSGKDLTKINKKIKKEEIDDDEIKKLKAEFYLRQEYSLSSYISFRKATNQPCKILVTYDSFHIIKSILGNKSILQDFRIIVDEFQSIFVDSRFKSSTELDFVNQLQDLQKVCFVSATPMMEEYLVQIENFKNLPYYSLDWNKLQEGRIIKPDLIVRSSKSVFTTAKSIIESYKSGQYEKAYRIGSNGKAECVESKEAVFYVNSVNNILSIIKRNSLSPDECNILCANTSENVTKIKKKLGKNFFIGKVPLRGEQHKMFTFCTRTVYLGADFYSTNARSFIISDANIDTLAVDISLDLPQILGRQRLIENPWKNKANFYYKPTAQAKLTSKDKFDAIIKKKENRTQDLLNAYQDTRASSKESLVDTYDTVAKLLNYRDDYVAVNKKYDSVSQTWIQIPVKNNLVIIAERRAFDIQQIDYKDRFSVFNTIEQNSILSGVDIIAKQFLEKYERQNNLYEKLKLLCTCNISDNIIKTFILPNITEKHFSEYYLIIGPDRIRSLGYNINRLNKELNIVTFNQLTLSDEIVKLFSVGDKLPKNKIKEILLNLYTLLKYDKIPKATDLEQWFELRAIKVKDSSGKWVHGFEIVKKKGD